MATDVKNLRCKLRETINMERKFQRKKVMCGYITDFIGNQVAYFRNLVGLRQVDLAEKIGISRHTIMNIEQCKFYYDIDILNKIFDCLDMKDKLVVKDAYIKFIFDNPAHKIRCVRERMDLMQKQMAKLL